MHEPYQFMIGLCFCPGNIVLPRIWPTCERVVLTQVVCLEATCVAFLGSRVHQMMSKSLLCLFKLGKHLRLHLLVLSAANELVKLPWEQNMQALGCMAKSLHRMDKERLNKLLHHPERGACSELQVLQLLEGIAMAEKDVAAYLDIDNMQPPELDTLLRILKLTDEQHAGQSVMLRKAVQSQLAKACKQPSELKGNTRFANNIYMTDVPAGVQPRFPDTQLDLLVAPDEATGMSFCHDLVDVELLIS